jgi:hypothetical protein
MLDDPNTVLRNHNIGLTITGGITLSVSTFSAPPPLFGGGAENIAFLLGNPGALVNPIPPGQNAQTIQMDAVFWIEAVEHTIEVPIFAPGDAPLTLSPAQTVPGHPVPLFSVKPPMPIEVPRTITVSSTQIQYSQRVILNFNGLSWPHISVATLVPANAVTISPTSW